MAEEDVRLEVEAVQAVYGDDCHLICSFPPHLTVHVKPRTADDSSLQFVEAKIGIKASTKYPEVPPHIYITDMKGMDDCRQAHLITSLQERAHELCSCPMLVALCEEAVDHITNMNHPEGDCPLCLYPLVSADRSGTSLPFMKLMSCYHCFHSECMIRLWKWTHEKNESNELNQILETAPASAEIQRDDTSQGQVLHGCMDQQKGNCPVCRKVFKANDIEHVLKYLARNSFAVNLVDAVHEDDIAVLHSEMEKSRRQQFETILKLQHENKGLIEPRKELSILPGMFLPEPRTTSAEARNDELNDHLPRKHSSDLNVVVPVKATTSKHKNSNRRRKGAPQGFQGNNGDTESSRKQWVVKPINSSKP